MRVPVAVHLDIRPRLRIPEGAPVAQRRRRRLPPLTLPAVGYWLAMGAATYAFAHLGPYPLEPSDAHAAEPERGAEPAPTQRPTPLPVAKEPAAPAEASPTDSLADASSQTLEAPGAEPRDVDVAAEPADPGSSAREATRRGARGDDLSSGSQQGPAETRVARAEPRPTATTPWEPHFTDSSKPEPPERASDGPRIAGLFERDGDGEEPHEPAAPSTPPPSDHGDSAPSRALTSCEAAIARSNEQMDLTHRGPADVTREAYASILENGRYLSGCSVPPRSVVEVCAAVVDGKAVGVTVTTSPPSASVAACVRSAVARLKFPSNSRLDVTHTRFEAVSR